MLLLGCDAKLDYAAHSQNSSPPKSKEPSLLTRTIDETKFGDTLHTQNSSPSKSRKPSLLTQTIDETQLLLSGGDAWHYASLPCPLKSNEPRRLLNHASDARNFTNSEKAIAMTNDDRKGKPKLRKRNCFCQEVTEVHQSPRSRRRSRRPVMKPSCFRQDVTPILETQL